jgi:predicted Zn finger-like uncharacterized protein
MILSCPACATEFQIDDGHIGPDGRMVRCSVCKHTWKAQKASEPIELKVTVKPRPETAETLKEVKAKKLPSKYRELVEDQKRQKALTAQAYVWAALASCLLLALAMAYVLRVDVVRTVPAFAGAYESIGLKVNGTNLEFDSYSAESNFKGGRFVVTVKAKIRNLSRKPTPVPPVRARLHDASLGLFDTQTIASDGLVVGPRATRTMIFDVKDARNMTASLDLGFDLEALKRRSKLPKISPDAKPVTRHAEAETHAQAAPAHGAPTHDGAEHIEPASSPTTLHAQTPLRGPTDVTQTVAQTDHAGHSPDIKTQGPPEDHPIRTAH